MYKLVCAFAPFCVWFGVFFCVDSIEFNDFGYEVLTIDSKSKILSPDIKAVLDYAALDPIHNSYPPKNETEIEEIKTQLQSDIEESWAFTYNGTITYYKYNYLRTFSKIPKLFQPLEGNIDDEEIFVQRDSLLFDNKYQNSFNRTLVRSEAKKYCKKNNSSFENIVTGEPFFKHKPQPMAQVALKIAQMQLFTVQFPSILHYYFIFPQVDCRNYVQ